MNPLSISSHVQRTSDISPHLISLTNKESVFGLFLDEMLQYYKSLPLELDFGFIKGMRKVHGKTS